MWNITIFHMHQNVFGIFYFLSYSNTTCEHLLKVSSLAVQLVLKATLKRRFLKLFFDRLSVSLFSHLPSWPRLGGLLLQLPTVHFPVQVPWIPLQVTIATVQRHSTCTLAGFISLTQQFFQNNMQVYLVFKKMTKADIKSLQSLSVQQPRWRQKVSCSWGNKTSWGFLNRMAHQQPYRVKQKVAKWYTLTRRKKTKSN